MSAGSSSNAPSRRDLLVRTGAFWGIASLTSIAPPSSAAFEDYASPLEALDDLDRLAAACRTRLGLVRDSRGDARLLTERFVNALDSYRATRNDVRVRFALPLRGDQGSPPGSVDADLTGLRQALDDLMIAYAESLPTFADSSVVSRLAVDMVGVSRLRTVIDLWIETEAV